LHFPIFLSGDNGR